MSNDHRQESVAPPPWSSPLAVSDVPQRGLDVTLVADAAQRERLAALNGLADLAFVEAKIHVARRGREGLHVTGRLQARATQVCVVSLEPFEVEIAEPIDVEFEPSRAPRPARDDKRRGARRDRDAQIEDVEEGMDDLDAPDEIVDGRIDLGALAAEFLALGVDPYPRKPGVAFEEPEARARPVSPFARLAPLAGKVEREDGQ